MNLRCVHMQAAGNDFIVVDGRGQSLNYPDMAKKLCAIAGTDGFMALEESEKADFRLHFYNRDGSRAAMCGNGSRCICKFACDLGLVGKDMSVQTDAGVITGQRLTDTRYRVKLPAPQNVKLQILPGVDYCICGVPHGVRQMKTLEKETLYEKAEELRHKLDCNVNFYQWLDRGKIQVLTYERGVEDFTLACGTGCGAVAAVLHTAGKLPGNCLTAVNPGGELTMEIVPETGEIFQTGSAEVVRVYRALPL